MEHAHPYGLVTATVGDLHAARAAFDCVERRLLLSVARDGFENGAHEGVRRAVRAAAGHAEHTSLQFIRECFGAAAVLKVVGTVGVARTTGEEALRRTVADYAAGLYDADHDA